MTGYIYKIVNDVNDQIYVGQTTRDIYIRFDEHCYDPRATSLIHHKIQEIGVSHFKIIEIEHFDNLEELDPLFLNQREEYWVKYYDSYNNGYNLTPTGQGLNKAYDHVEVVENHLVFDSAEDMSGVLAKYTGWSTKYAVDKVREAVYENKPFLNEYHLIKSNKTVSSVDDLEEWCRALKVYYHRKAIKLVETGDIFESQSDAAAFLIKNKYYSAKESASPMQSAVSLISRAVKTGQPLELSGKTFTFEDTMVRSKQIKPPEVPFKCCQVYCPQLQTTFKSQENMAQFIINNHLWGNITIKTAKLRISDLARGYFKHYQNYQAYNLNSNKEIIVPEYLDGAPGEEVNWVASEKIINAAHEFVEKTAEED